MQQPHYYFKPYFLAKLLKLSQTTLASINETVEDGVAHSNVVIYCELWPWPRAQSRCRPTWEL